MFISAAVDVQMVFSVSLFAFGMLVFKNFGCFVKWGEINKIAEKGLTWRFSSLLFSLIYKLPYIFQTILKSYMLCKNTKKKFESTNMGLAHFKILIFPDFSRVGCKTSRQIL